MYESMDIVILAVIAGFIIFKLYSILGQGDEELLSKALKGRAMINVSPRETPESESLKRINKDEAVIVVADARSEIEAIADQDKSFELGKFMFGANKAFEMILAAFASCDKDFLKKMVSKEVYGVFCGDIDKRMANGHVLEKTLVSVLSSEIIGASLNKKNATISVRFVSQQINVLKDIAGTIINGDVSEIDNIEEIWTFSRNILLDNPNWLLAETRLK